MAIDLSTIQALSVALALGVLVGLQRERSDEPLAGVRTFPLVALTGALSALMDGAQPGIYVIIGGLAVVAYTVIGNLMRIRAGDYDPGLTTEVALFAVFLVGAAAGTGALALAAICGGTTALLLYLKGWSHAVVARFSDADVRAVMQFALIAAVILPLLPNQDFGPHEAFNPFETWLMVVFIVGLNLVGYVAVRLSGERAGTLASGLLSGLVSSTAATASFSRRVRAGIPAAVGALGIMLASTVLVARVLVEVALVGPSVLDAVAPPLLILLAVHVVVAVGAFLRVKGHDAAEIAQKNPAEVRAALVFGALYALIKLGVAFAQESLGQAGLFIVAVISGLTDVDAITLSTAQFMSSGRVSTEDGWRVIMVAIMANLVFKAGIAASLGGMRLLRRIVVVFGIAMIAALSLLWLYPG